MLKKEEGQVQILLSYLFDKWLIRDAVCIAPAANTRRQTAAADVLRQTDTRFMANVRSRSARRAGDMSTAASVPSCPASCSANIPAIPNMATNRRERV